MKNQYTNLIKRIINEAITKETGETVYHYSDVKPHIFDIVKDMRNEIHTLNQRISTLYSMFLRKMDEENMKRLAHDIKKTAKTLFTQRNAIGKECEKIYGKLPSEVKTWIATDFGRTFITLSRILDKFEHIPTDKLSEQDFEEAKDLVRQLNSSIYKITNGQLY